MSKKNNLTKRRNQHNFDLQREKQEKQKRAEKLQANKSKMKEDRHPMSQKSSATCLRNRCRSHRRPDRSPSPGSPDPGEPIGGCPAASGQGHRRICRRPDRSPPPGSPDPGKPVRGCPAASPSRGISFLIFF
ncbi:hypothetical protein KSP39_PZI004038 [Platanthera zijinensis]|uniref:Uncharacterized protein n=1 Tax=Platanthera zijinensis TaxID=2320716 RepID=A0AAP0GC88_9ASPA